MKLLAPLVLALAAIASTASAQTVVNGSGCGGLVIGHTGSTSLGSNYTFTMSGAPASANCALFIGQPAAPIDLSFVGMTGCELRLTVNASIPFVADGTGNLAIPITITTDSAAIGAVIGTQFGAINIGINPLGVAMTAQMSSTIEP